MGAGAESSSSAREEKQIADLPSETYEAGEVIFREGDESKSVAYLVHQGAVEVRRRVDGEERVLNTSPRAICLVRLPCSAMAPTRSPPSPRDQVTLLPIPADRLESMVLTNPRLAIELIRQLARMAAGKV
jgi:cAMP-binding proteins - catabolite gene activator and regulatory subunit of cAMP-dependent protein kinases